MAARDSWPCWLIENRQITAPVTNSLRATWGHPSQLGPTKHYPTNVKVLCQILQRKELHRTLLQLDQSILTTNAVTVKTRQASSNTD